MHKTFLLFALNLCTLPITAQEQNPWQQAPQVHLSGFMDIFYIYDFNQPQGTDRQDFLFNHNRHNEFNVNLGLVQLDLQHAKYRANLSLQTGTYANDNYAAEPGLLKNIFEASVGISLSKRNNLWLDAGVFPSHLGFESAISLENMTLTRSLAAESSPYFLSGAKITFNPNNELEFVALVTNGWQRIQRLEGNSLPSFGTQIIYQPKDGMTLNWSTFIGTDDPDSTRRMRFFNNFFGQLQLSEKVALIAGFDIGFQQNTKASEKYELWYVPTLIAQYAINEQWSSALRAEYYHDESGVIIPTFTMNGFQTTGLSMNFDYAPAPNLLCRIEGRWFRSEDEIFETNTSVSSNNIFVGASLAIRFSDRRKQ